jgi:DNA-binding NtrC family response regulator
MNVRVMLVDDEEDFVETLGERLETRGFVVTTAVDGDQCVAKLREDPVDVVVLDLQMPGKDGIETLGEIKAGHPLVEVIMLTGHATIESAIDGLKLGAYDYLPKPAETADLMGKILKAYARKSEQEERIRRAEIEKLVSAGVA